MTRHDTPQRSPIPPAARFVATHVAGRTWMVRADGPGAGSAWGHALAALAHRSHTSTDGSRPTFWVDEDALRRFVVEASGLGVRCESVDGTSLPTALVR